jgi:hypothetical protein
MTTVLRDIRYFEAEGHGFKTLPSYAGSLYAFPKVAISIGQRLACKCEELGVSIGRSSHLYIALVPTLEAAQVVLSSYQAELWHRFVSCGLPRAFNEIPLTDQLRQIEELTLSAIRACSDQNDLIQEVERQARSAGEAMAIVRREKDTKRYNVKVMFTVAPFGAPSMMWLRVHKKETGRIYDTERIRLGFYDHVYDLADKITLKEDTIIVRPRTSFRASLTTRDYETPIKVDIAPLVAAQPGVPADSLGSGASPLRQGRG